MKAASLFLALVLLAGCSGGEQGEYEPSSTTGAATGTASSTTNGTASREVFPGMELLNKTYTLHPTASPGPDTVTVPAGHDLLHIAAEVTATAMCFYTNTEPAVEYMEPGVYVTSPAGNLTLLTYDTPSSCDPLGTFPRRLDLKTLEVPAEEGSWSFQIRSTGQNAEIRLVIRAGSPPTPYT